VCCRADARQQNSLTADRVSLPLTLKVEPSNRYGIVESPEVSTKLADSFKRCVAIRMMTVRLSEGDSSS